MKREQFTVEERAKFLHDTITAQRRFLAEQRAIAIKNKPPTRTQCLIKKFTAVGSTEDEKRIKEMNEGIKDTTQKRLKEEDTAHVPAKVEVTEQGTKKIKGGHIKMITRKKSRKQSDDDSDDEHRKCLKIVTFEGTSDSEIMEKKSVIARLDKVSSPDGDYLVIYRANGNFRAFNYLMEVLHIFDRQDLFHLYELMMEQYLEITLEVFELILWGDLKIMMESSTEENDKSDLWSNQQDWKIITWRLYEACGVCILELEDGIVIHMLVERRYPLSKDLLQRMLDLGLEVERECTIALDLIRVFNSHCFMVKSWLVQDQTVLGKDYSNMLIADSLLKTIWFINAPCYGNEALASPKANGWKDLFSLGLTLGHANMRLIQSLASKELVRNLPKLKFDQHFCDACKIRKQAHTSHKAKNMVSTTRYLELLHMDLFGPSAVRSDGGNRYTLVIVDDYSRKIEESLNVTFNETPPPSKTSPLMDDDLDEEEAIEVTEKKNLKIDIEDETLEIDEIVNIKESRNHPPENVKGNLNQRTL
ncbi:retrovirus-related pol polyprotein from transposon TNT 1-94 [Tanacetum coccineum]